MNNPILLCDDCVVDQAGQLFSLWQGLSKIHQQQLLDFSKNDPLITENTSDSTRFASVEKLQHWLSGQRLVSALSPKEKPNELSGLVWFSHEPLPLKIDDQQAKNAQWTFGIRLYTGARGKHLSLPFMAKTFEYFWQEHPHQSVWLSTRKTNAISQKIYTRFGFVPIVQRHGKIFYIMYARQ